VKKKFMISLAGLLIAGAMPILAHHSFAAEYDDKSPIQLNGAITKVEWANPHIVLYIDVKDEAGKVTNWSLEGGPPNGLFRQGWRKDTLKPGDMVKVEGFRAKDHSNLVNMRTIIRAADGKKMFAGTSGDGAPGEK